MRKCISWNGQIWTNPDFSESLFVATQRNLNWSDLSFFVFPKGPKTVKNFKKIYFFKSWISTYHSKALDALNSKNAKIFEKILLLDVLLPIKGSKSGIFDIFLRPNNYINAWSDFAKPRFFWKPVCSYRGCNATKIEAIYSFFVFSQGSKNGQKFQKNIFFKNWISTYHSKALDALIPKMPKFFEKMLLFALLLAMKAHNLVICFEMFKKEH